MLLPDADIPVTGDKDGDGSADEWVLLVVDGVSIPRFDVVIEVKCRDEDDMGVGCMRAEVESNWAFVGDIAPELEVDDDCEFLLNSVAKSCHESSETSSLSMSWEEDCFALGFLCGGERV